MEVNKVCFIESVKAVRESRGLSQAALADRVGVTQAAISKYEKKGRPIPEDVAIRMTEVLKSPRLHAEYLYENRMEFFNSPLLNNVDDHLVLVLDVLVDELAEAREAAMENAKLLRNKKKDSDIDRHSWQKVIENEMQILDLYANIKLHLIRMDETFEKFSIKELELRHQGKLKMKKYIR